MRRAKNKPERFKEPIKQLFEGFSSLVSLAKPFLELITPQQKHTKYSREYLQKILFDRRGQTPPI
jgi:hypothetical protein